MAVKTKAKRCGGGEYSFSVVLRITLFFCVWMALFHAGEGLLLPGFHTCIIKGTEYPTPDSYTCAEYEAFLAGISPGGTGTGGTGTGGTGTGGTGTGGTGAGGGKLPPLSPYELMKYELHGYAFPEAINSKNPSTTYTELGGGMWQLLSHIVNQNWTAAEIKKWALDQGRDIITNQYSDEFLTKLSHNKIALSVRKPNGSFHQPWNLTNCKEQDWVRKTFYKHLENGEFFDPIDSIPPELPKDQKDKISFPYESDCITGATKHYETKSRDKMVKLYNKRHAEDKKEWEKVCKDIEYPELDLKKVNEKANEKFGKRCRSETCHYHVEVHELICRSSSIQAMYGFIAFVVLAGLGLRQTVA